MFVYLLNRMSYISLDSDAKTKYKNLTKCKQNAIIILMHWQTIASMLPNFTIKTIVGYKTNKQEKGEKQNSNRHLPRLSVVLCSSIMKSSRRLPDKEEQKKYGGFRAQQIKIDKRNKTKKKKQNAEKKL